MIPSVLAIISEHECSYEWGGPQWDCGANDCNASGWGWEEYAAHIAQVIEAAS